MDPVHHYKLIRSIIINTHIVCFAFQFELKSFADKFDKGKKKKNLHSYQLDSIINMHTHTHHVHTPRITAEQADVQAAVATTLLRTLPFKRSQA